MADKDFGIKRLNLVGASGTPTITSPTDLIIRANNVAISTNSTIGGNLGIGTTTPTSRLTVQGDVLVSGVLTARNIVGTSLSISGISTIANFRIINVGTGATVGGIGVVTYYGDGSQLENIAVDYADRAGISTNVIGGIASVTSLNVTGITTLRSIVGTSLSITGISTIANFLMTPVGTGATVGGIGVVTYYGDGSGLTKINSSAIVGVATYADRAGIATNVIGGIASVTSLNVTGITTLGITSTTNLTSQQLNVSGITTLASIVGTSLSISGISTISNFLMTPVGTGATVGGIGVTYYGDGSQLINISSSSIVGVVTYADRAGIATNVIGGIASVTSLDVSGITTLRSIVGTSLSITGISTIANFRITNVGTGATVGGIGVTYYGDGSQLTNINSSSIVGVITYADRAGIATNVIGGIASVTSLDVSGITTLRSIVGTSLSITGISTIANFRMSPVGAGATVGGIGVTYYGDGSQLTGIGVSVASYAERAGIATNVIGGIASVTSLNVTGITTLASIVGTSLSITGISTLGTVQISSGIITATTSGIVTYYGDGSKLTNILSGIGVGTAGGTVGTGITFLDFRGAGISSITSSAGIATITIPGSSRTVSTYTAEAGRTSFDATYTIDVNNRYVDVYLNGAKLSSAEYTATDGTTVNLIEGASLNDIVEIIGYSINITGETSISPVMMGMIF